MSTDQLAALGAFLSGAGSVIGGAWVVHSVRRRAELRCQERIRELREAYGHGLSEGLHLEERDETAK